ncbi:hypothetical protein [Kangiella sediminilitoris]|uniref:Lipoprotein n=1 Tax=Kangiella sediminilitoris TaxID=1144748 RepID=A0A1B3BDU6_9GAMM|nr:hypothetical protein [Kangiella sediminilitoris]AOE50996.1 hypothetical protein KS2013_2292 [Kangiella sediminilitoris]
MFKPLIIIGLSFAFLGCATTTSKTANTAPQASKQVAEKEDDEGPKVICKRTHRVGTNFKQVQCWNREEYAAKKEADKEAIRQLQRSTMAPPEGQ